MTALQVLCGLSEKEFEILDGMPNIAAAMPCSPPQITDALKVS